MQVLLELENGLGRKKKKRCSTRARGAWNRINRQFRKWRMGLYGLGEGGDLGQGGGRGGIQMDLGRSTIFKMADRSTINLYASGGLVRNQWLHVTQCLVAANDSKSFIVTTAPASVHSLCASVYANLHTIIYGPVEIERQLALKLS